jgi:hypothetical protein
MSGLYPNEFAELMKPRAGEKYRPSNGTEGEIFLEWFCARCTKGETACPILGATFMLAVEDPLYPPEWTYGEDGQPKCTAFEEEPA